MQKFTLFLIISSLFVTWVNSTEHHNIIIIGAGPSGIATASKLLENGIEDILILEAESRIGGRINTVNFDGRNVDLGAEWCHGEKNNIVWEILQNRDLLNLLEKEQPPEAFYISSRQNITKEFSKELFNIMFDIYFDDNQTDTQESVGVSFQKRYNKIVNEKYKNENNKLQIAKLAIEYSRHAIMSLEGTLSWYDSASTSDYEEADGYFSFGWKNFGYHIFLDILTKKYPNPKEQLPIDNKITLNKEVTNISVGNSVVSIVCKDNSEYTANHVVFTPSLGVLKEQAKTLFVPSLPKRKLEAIERIGIGAVMKVYLKYDTKWWGDLSGFNFIWTEADRLSSKENFPAGPSNSKGESWIVEIYNALTMSNSTVLLVWITGELLPVIEKMDEKTLVDGIEYTLNQFLGNTFNISKVQKSIRTNWYSNPHFRGTYSFSTPRSSGKDIENLSTPIVRANGQPILQFAGEATNPKHHSTVHGAVESGFREANRLIELHKTSNNQVSN